MRPLTVPERKVLAHLLERAAELFSNHGCNDLDLIKIGLTAEESYELRRAMELAFDPDNVSAPTQHITEDWLMMRYFVARVKP